MAVRVRPARPQDAAALAEMANDLNDHVGVRGRPFTPERVRAAAFGRGAAFTALVAERDGAVAGYAFFSPGYNTDVAARAMWLHDIFVVPAARGLGVGHALMTAVAAETVRTGCASLEWGVHDDNGIAHAFYRRIQASMAPVRIMGLDGERLRAMAAAAPPRRRRPGGPRRRRARTAGAAPARAAAPARGSSPRGGRRPAR
jgi:GNAT superfamily N-acetyltransferase